MRIKKLTAGAVLMWLTLGIFLPASLHSVQEGGNSKVVFHFLRALYLENHGDLQRALQEYDLALAADGSAASVYRQKTGIYLKLGDPERALAEARAYAKFYPDDPDALSLLSNVQILLGQKSSARENLEKVLSEKPDNVETLFALATLTMNDEPEKAVPLFEKVIALDPSYLESLYDLGLLYQKKGDKEKSKQMFKKVIELDPSSLPSLILMGQMSEKEKDPDQAIGYYEDALAKMPENFALRLQLILLYAQKTDLDRIEQLLGSYKNNPSAPVEANLWLGIVYESRKDWDQSLKYYLRARKQSSSAELNVRLAGLYSQIGKPGKALKFIRALVRSAPREPQFRYFLGLAYLDMKRPARAVREFQQALALKKDFPSACFQMGVALDNVNRWDDAEKMFRESVRLDSGNAEACNYIGYTLVVRNERLFEARRMIEKALEMEPFNPAFIDSLGWLNFREGKYENALRYLKEASERLPDPVIEDHLGDCYAALGNISEAAVAYSKSLENDPGSRSVRAKLDKLNARMVPTSPGRRLLKDFQFNLNRATDISGILFLRSGTGAARLFTAGSSQGLFYLKKDSEPLTELSSRSVNTQLRLDLASSFSLPVTLSFNNRPKARWGVFPSEIRDRLPGATGRILENVASFLNGEILQDFDSTGTAVTIGRSKVTLSKSGDRMVFDKKKGFIEEVDLSGSDSFSMRVERYEKFQGVWLPRKIRFAWREPATYVREQLEIEFAQFSMDRIENKIFENSSAGQN